MFVRERDAPDISSFGRSAYVCAQQPKKRHTDDDDDTAAAAADNVQNQQLAAIESEWVSRRVSSSWSHKWKFLTLPYYAYNETTQRTVETIISGFNVHSATCYAITYRSVYGVRCELVHLTNFVFSFFYFFELKDTAWKKVKLKSKIDKKERLFK